jgi:sugar phosphate isomerase/epimerase
MAAARLTDLSRLCVHTITTKPWTLEQAVDNYAAAGIGGITVWRQALAGHAPGAAGERIRAAGLKIVSLCRGGFFPARDAAGRQAAIDENRRVVDEAAALGAPLVVLVCGAVPGLALSEARRQIADGISAVLPHATACRVKLAIEPLHPMYADDRSAVNTMRQAADICAELRSPWLGIAVDVYHVWWDPDLEAEIARAGRQRWLAAFHVCDWRTPTTDLLEDRGLPGEGCIPVRTIRGWVEETGFDGFNEVEVFSRTRWAEDQHKFLRDIQDSYLKHV